MFCNYNIFKRFGTASTNHGPYSKDGWSVINLTDSSGSVIEAYSYDEYGMPLSNLQHTDNRYLYTGREFDAETGLYYYRARYYDPAIGRFLQADPLGIDEENTYTYCYNSPVNYTDPFGLQGEYLGIGLGGVIPPVTGRPKPGIWQPPSSDVLPMPELPPQEATNTNIRSKTKAKQLGLSESITHAATEGEVEKSEKKKDPNKENWWEKFKKCLNDLFGKTTGRKIPGSEEIHTDHPHGPYKDGHKHWLEEHFNPMDPTKRSIERRTGPL